MSPTISLNDKIFKAKNFLKSVFGTVIMPINKCCYIMLHGVKLILNVCLWKRIPYCLYAQPMFVFWTCRIWITSKTQINQIPCAQLSCQHILQIRRSKKKLHVLGLNKSLEQSLQHVHMYYGCWKISSRNALKKENDFML